MNMYSWERDWMDVVGVDEWANAVGQGHRCGALRSGERTTWRG